MTTRKRIYFLSIVSLVIIMFAILSYALWKDMQKNQVYMGTFVGVYSR